MHTHTQSKISDLLFFSSDSLFLLCRPNFSDVTNIIILNQAPPATCILILSQVEDIVIMSPKFSQTKLFFLSNITRFSFFLQIIPHINYPTNWFWAPKARTTIRQNFKQSTAAAAAAKSLQSCPTLCDPIDNSPPGFSIPGILQARILEWVAISFSSFANVMGTLKYGLFIFLSPCWAQISSVL